MKDILTISDQSRLPESIETALQLLSIIQRGGELPAKITKVTTTTNSDTGSKDITFHIEESL